MMSTWRGIGSPTCSSIRRRLERIRLSATPCGRAPGSHCAGATFGGRVAASLVSAVGIPELIADSLKDYRECALRLARDPLLLASLKAKLAIRRKTCPLF